MTVRVNIVYAGDRSTDSIADVLPTSTIESLKEQIAQLNDLPDWSSIKIVRRGRIYPGATLVSALGVAPDSTVTIYVTGIPSRNPDVPAPEPVPDEPPAAQPLGGLSRYLPFVLVGVVVLLCALCISLLRRTQSDVAT
jgi:hypothetical protein